MMSRALAAALLPAMMMTVTMTADLAQATGTVTISDDRGGRIGDYLAKYQALKRSGEEVVVDGTCASACTMLLGIIPANRICVTPRAVFEFHAAWDMTPSGGKTISRAGDRVLWSYYPGKVRRWIVRHGGLRTQILFLRDGELAAMFPSCH